MSNLFFCFLLLSIFAYSAEASDKLHKTAIKKEVEFLKENFDSRVDHQTTFENDGCNLKWSYGDGCCGLNLSLTQLNIKTTLNIDYIPSIEFSCNDNANCIHDIYEKKYLPNASLSLWGIGIDKVGPVEKSIKELIHLCGGKKTDPSNLSGIVHSANSRREAPRKVGWEITDTFYNAGVKTFNIKCSNGNTNQINYFSDSRFYGTKGKLFNTLKAAANNICQ